MMNYDTRFDRKLNLGTVSEFQFVKGNVYYLFY